jgi:hypothetical protein
MLNLLTSKKENVILTGESTNVDPSKKIQKDYQDENEQ